MYKISHHILVLLAVVLSLVNARSVYSYLNSGVKTLAHLPGNRIQIDNLLETICSDLEFILDEYTSEDTCIQNFWGPQKFTTPRTELKVLCRSKDTVKIELTPSDYWQLVVLIPEKEIADEDSFINYRLIEPKTRFGELDIFTSSRAYIIFSTVLDKDSRPSLWEGQTRVPAWHDATAPLHKNYEVQVQFMNYSKIHDQGTITGVVTWNHTGDSDVCFDFTNYCYNGKMKNMKIWPDTGPKVIIEDLALGVKCEIHVSGMYGATKFSYRTPTREAYDNSTRSQSQDTKPELSRNISVVAMEHAEGWEVHVGWAKPHVIPDSYSVVLRADGINVVNVSGNATEAVFPSVTGDGLYNVSVYAFKGHIRGHSFVRAIFPGRTRWAGAAGGIWGAAALGTLAIALCCATLRTRVYSRRKPQTQESKPLDEDLEALEAESCEDQWEVKSERLLLHEVIGEGAFGVVKRGTLAPTGKEVAVKMLKEFPSVDEVRSFRLETELMKSVGAHPHVVSLVGCCSGKRPLIVAEYCARGDLLTFLRRSWNVMVSKRNAKYYNNNIETSDYRNDLFKWSFDAIRREHSRLVVNKMYDMQAICDSDLTSLDLLSFCRQIAMGMEFLASNRLVHRDLAARNILVTGDRTLKIADFGLSRDVYEENQYKQKGNGKMPVKWMALESLTRRIYSSQSDVWSFGVVVWEVVTVGGAPYPEVPAARLPRLLRAGYRMPRPPNCSKQLYELMQCCWRAHPRERPTFAELHQRLDELLNCACADDYLCLELDDEPPPASRAAKYLKYITRAKRWNRESYERPLKAMQGVGNHYTSPPATLAKAPA